jgi:flagellar motor protein MotB
MDDANRRLAAAVSHEVRKCHTIGQLEHGIPAARLTPAGSGPLAPVAPNETEEGRTKHRRVELVKQ